MGTKNMQSRTRGLVVQALCVLTSLSSAAPASAGQGPIVEYSLPANSVPLGIAWGPDGNVWFTEAGVNKIGRMTPDGSLTEFPVPVAAGMPTNMLLGITAGPDGAMWFAEEGADTIGRITTDGDLTEFPLPTAGGPSYLMVGPRYITSGPDGNLWFYGIKGHVVGRMSPLGVLTGQFADEHPGGQGEITTGPDGNLWFTTGDGVARMTPDGVATYFVLPSHASAWGIAPGPDGNLWFSEWSNKAVGRITTAGAIAEFPGTSCNTLRDVARGPDGNMWIVDFGRGLIRVTTSGQMTEFAEPNVRFAVVAGGDGGLWFTTQANTIGRSPTDPDAAVLGCSPPSGTPVPASSIGSLGLAALMAVLFAGAQARGRRRRQTVQLGP